MLGAKHLSLKWSFSSRNGVQEQPGLSAATRMKIYSHYSHVMQVGDQREKDLLVFHPPTPHTIQQLYQQCGPLQTFRASSAWRTQPPSPWIPATCAPFTKNSVISGKKKKKKKSLTSPVMRRWAQIWLWVAALHSKTSRAQPIKGNI